MVAGSREFLTLWVQVQISAISIIAQSNLSKWGWFFFLVIDNYSQCFKYMSYLGFVTNYKSIHSQFMIVLGRYGLI